MIGTATSSARDANGLPAFALAASFDKVRKKFNDLLGTVLRNPVKGEKHTYVLGRETL
jgi:hypothetical protein